MTPMIYLIGAIVGLIVTKYQFILQENFGVYPKKYLF